MECHPREGVLRCRFLKAVPCYTNRNNQEDFLISFSCPAKPGRLLARHFNTGPSVIRSTRLLRLDWPIHSVNPISNGISATDWTGLRGTRLRTRDLIASLGGFGSGTMNLGRSNPGPDTHLLTQGRPELMRRIQQSGIRCRKRGGRRSTVENFV
jgi:hypothetical protein